MYNMQGEFRNCRVLSSDLPLRLGLSIMVKRVANRCHLSGRGGRFDACSNTNLSWCLLTCSLLKHPIFNLPFVAVVYKKLAERVMKDIEKQLEVEESRRKHEQDQRELVWARAKRNTLLMRHPTNWAASLFQVSGFLHLRYYYDRATAHLLRCLRHVLIGSLPYVFWSMYSQYVDCLRYYQHHV